MQSEDGDDFAAWFNPLAPHPSDLAHAKAQRGARDRAEAAIKRAEKAARRGDPAEAKRWSEIAVKLAEAARTLAEAPAPDDDPAREERLRAELRQRIRALVDRDVELQRWEMRLEIWAAQARAEGRPLPPPMPPRPPHWSDDLHEDVREHFR